MHSASRVLLLALTLLLVSFPLLAQPLDDDPAALKARLMKHRLDEAALKARLHEGLVVAERERTPNQDRYDAVHYDLSLDLNPTTRILTGSVTTVAEVLAGPLSVLDLDLQDAMTVSGVTAGGTAVTWSHASDLLTVNLDRSYATGETVTVIVDYGGNPAGDTFGWDSHNGDPMIWTLSEPYGARDWWPCKDLNSDKPDSVDMRVTVPEELIVASNGLLVSEVDNGSTKTYHWHEGHPIATYLVSLAIHPYTVYSDWYTPLDGGEDMEIRFFVYPDHFSSVQATYALTKDMIHEFAEGYGEYPFVDEKYGHAEFNWGGGMEHQTLTSLGGWTEDLISHELAHQWWGDMITCEDFHHIWLNEGFATWSEAYWKEQAEGFETYKAYMNGAAYYGDGTIYVEDPNNFYAIFDTNLSYNKASWVVHMLRGVLGDADFFDGLALYRATYGYGSATTEEFQAAMESVSGLDLGDFFQQWIYGEYFPVYLYSWSQDGATLDLNIQQTQTNTGLFTMPIRLVVETTTGSYDFTVQNSLAEEDYALTVDGQVLSVQVDPDRWILRQVQSTVSNPTFDEGILVVNGVDWDTYDTEIISAYEDSVYWGDFDMDFWDNFAEPSGGYPANLPEPLGHGSVPADVIGRYSTVVWVGNNYNGDLTSWMETPIASYLDVGGNVLLLTRRGQSFLDDALTDYLGISWSGTQVTLGNCTAAYAGLENIAFTGTQSWNDVFSTTVGPNSTLLFKDTSSNPDRGTGVHAQPAGGGSHRPEGAQLAFLSGRSYRMSHDSLRANVVYILDHFFGEPWIATVADENAPAAAAALGANYPNPFNPHTTIPFSLPAETHGELAIYDTGGRLVKVLATGLLPAGEQSVVWQGLDRRGRSVASGVYLAKLSTADRQISRRLVLLR